MIWKKLTQQEISNRVFGALDKNVNYSNEIMLGVPASYLDEKVFSQDSTLLKDAPFLTAMVQNPNHIGCHTIGQSESFFSGTHDLERELIAICAEDILHGEHDSFDGYVASGGTEANMQAIWIYRNFYQKEFKAKANEITILCSTDSHYSMDKAANVLGIGIYKVQTDENTRELLPQSVEQQIDLALADGIKYFIVVANMMTTMFGSVDDPSVYTSVLRSKKVEFKLHIDGAYGGFYYPFSNKENELNFSNPDVTSITLDAHKMAQAPYGTGIFLIRKGFIHYANTKQASYVEGEDCTLIGSRSGANAIAVWMILSKYGPNGWFEKIFVLQKRTDWICDQLDGLGIDYFRDPNSNIVTIKSSGMPQSTAAKFNLVPDNHHSPSWFKIVVMEHVTLEKLIPLVDDLKHHFGTPSVL